MNIIPKFTLSVFHRWCAIASVTILILLVARGKVFGAPAHRAGSKAEEYFLRGDARGQLNEVDKSYPDAIADFSKAIDCDTRPEQTLLLRARLYRKLGKYQLAIDDCSRIRRTDWTADEALVLRAEMYELLGQKQLAKEDREELKYQRAHTVRFTVGGPTRIILNSTTGTKARAVVSDDISKIIKKAPKSRIKQVRGAQALVPKGLSQLEYYHLARNFGGIQPKQCLECITLVEHMNPTSTLVKKATRLRETMMPKRMPSDEAIELNRLAHNCFSDHDKCRSLVLGSLALCPDSEYAYITLGALEKDCGNYAEAERNFRRARDINPHNVEALSRLGDVVRDHNVAEAKAIWQQAVNLDPDDVFDGSMLELYKNNH